MTAGRVTPSTTPPLVDGTVAEVGGASPAVTSPLDTFTQNWAPQALLEKVIAAVPNMVATLAGWVEIPSVGQATSDADGKPIVINNKPGEPFGPELRRMLDTAIADAGALGLDTYVDRDGFYGVAKIGSGSRRIVMPVHLDVVPPPEGTKPSDWVSGDPFALAVQDGNVYGRGTADDKGPGVMALHVLAALKDVPLKPGTELHVVLFMDEERGDWTRDVPKYLNDFGAPDIAIVPDAAFPGLLEDTSLVQVTVTGAGKPLPVYKTGDIEVKSVTTGTNAPNMIPGQVRSVVIAPDEFKLEELKIKLEGALGSDVAFTPLEQRPDGRYTTEIIVTGVTEHVANTPKGKNALQMYAQAMEGVGMVDTPSARVLVMIQESFGYGYGGEAFGFNTSAESPHFVNFSVLKANGTGIEGVVDARCRPGVTADMVSEPVGSMANGAGFSAKVTTLMGPTPVPGDSLELQILKDAVIRHIGVEHPIPRIMGGTYARAFNTAKRLAMAFGMMLPGDVETEHKLNEYTPLRTLAIGGMIYADALYALAANPAASLLGGTGSASEAVVMESSGLRGVAAASLTGARETSKPIDIAERLPEIEKAVQAALRARDTVARVEKK